MTGTDDELNRARQHLRNATLEGLEAAGALLSAASRATGLDPEAAGPVVAELGRQLDRWLVALRRGERFELPRGLAVPLDEALAAEIARWERRSQTDPDARPVLRAFLGLRELLYELGVRGAGPEKRSASKTPATGRPRVQRFDIEE